MGREVTSHDFFDTDMGRDVASHNKMTFCDIGMGMEVTSLMILAWEGDDFQ
jgi:hypothetical protein